MKNKQSKPSPDKKPKKIITPKELLARQAVLEGLSSIFKHGQGLEYALNVMRESDLHGDDRAFAEHLLKASLKKKFLLDGYMEQFLLKPLSHLPLQAQLLLLIGAVQCHYMQVPFYAAVNTTVELAKVCGLHRLTGMMNVVLKKISQHKPQFSHADMLHAAPRWLSDGLTADYGKEVATTIINQSMNDVHYVDLTIHPDMNIEDVAAHLNAEHIYGASLRLPHAKAIPLIAGYKKGYWWVQDMAAALPLYGMRSHLKGKRVLDIGAAPGGKTMQLVAYSAEVTALDRSAKRLVRLEENLARTQLKADIVCADVMEFEPTEPYDVIVLDAPCSATGTLRRNPDILYQRTAQDVEELATLQSAMLAKAASWLKPNGLLLYCSCSLFKREGEAQIAAFLRNHDYQRVSFEGLPAHMMNEQGDYRAHPFYETKQGGMDGFFAALLRKNTIKYKDIAYNV
jgi:16S rRNA (cytosine967-C5)-methyltransferase